MVVQVVMVVQVEMVVTVMRSSSWWW